jgi:hypothetical protein
VRDGCCCLLVGAAALLLLEQLLTLAVNVAGADDRLVDAVVRPGALRNQQHSMLSKAPKESYGCCPAR